ncbi:glycosyltransferase [Pectobacterium carotovorum]|uniref:glycosyltransferase n=1 Tax=Pectobacterium carotovorum TaxID=554 RepID=UPI000692378D|nr:glycosyltransferase [Pectobacterium carotovorum]MBA0192251.1 glycosyltransferase [Pectobacterium carotovorum]MBA0199536.1 glycosyltransferase [Pectobacterium carotovorum]
MLTILMAAYNGEKYIFEQINSIFESSKKEKLKLKISLDLSSDSTEEIISELNNKNVDIYIHRHRLGSAKNNFSWMIDNCTDEDGYFMFSDQDDVWTKGKIDSSLEQLKLLESEYGKNTPCLVFTDAYVVDKNLNIIVDSFVKSSNFDIDKGLTFPRLMVQNVGQGCTFAFNSALLKLAKKIPKEAIMHDWWMMLIASYFGKIKFLSEATVLYRQHADNEIGARSFNIKEIVRQMKSNSFKLSIERTQKQAAAFLHVFEKKLDNETKSMLECFSVLNTYPFFKRKYFIFKYGLRKSGVIRTLGFYFLL